MAKRRAPLFLKRKSYRLRRLRDAARLLPLVGGFLVLLPILWSPSGSSGADTAWDGIYLFVVWFGLVLVAAALAPGLVHDAPEGDGGDGEPR
jgi:4-hydroxybenzoate polyprenyltransferase